MKTLEVVAAIIVDHDEILCMQRGAYKLSYISKKYEFPGGKVEVGESLQTALMRELDEELKMDIIVDDLFLTVDHTYPDFHIIMHGFLCHVLTRELQLTEHIDYKWLSIDKLETLDWAAADLPIVKKLQVQQ